MVQADAVAGLPSAVRRLYSQSGGGFPFETQQPAGAGVGRSACKARNPSVCMERPSLAPMQWSCSRKLSCIGSSLAWPQVYRGRLPDGLHQLQ